MKKQIHVYYSGRVQGVGFRYTVEEIAIGLGICGWIKNLREGRVELLAEAEEEKLVRFLEKIKDYFSSYITNTDIQWLEARGEYSDFRITF